MADKTSIKLNLAPGSGHFERVGNNLVITDEAGQPFVIEDFFVLDTGSQLPILEFSDGTKIASADFLTAMDIDISTAAGPNSAPQQGSSGIGEYADITGTTVQGVSRLAGVSEAMDEDANTMRSGNSLMAGNTTQTVDPMVFAGNDTPDVDPDPARPRTVLYSDGLYENHETSITAADDIFVNSSTRGIWTTNTGQQTVNADQLSVHAKESGISTTGQGTAHINVLHDAEITSGTSHGVHSKGDEAQTHVNVGGNLTINAADGGIATFAGGENTITVGKDLTINADRYGIYADNYKYGAHSSKNTVTVDENLTIKLGDNNRAGIYAWNTGTTAGTAVTNTVTANEIAIEGPRGIHAVVEPPNGLFVDGATASNLITTSNLDINASQFGLTAVRAAENIIEGFADKPLVVSIKISGDPGDIVTPQALRAAGNNATNAIIGHSQSGAEGDSITIAGDVYSRDLTANNTIQTGDGDSRISITGNVTAERGATADIRGGAGNDHIEVTGAIEGGVTIDGGAGDDIIILKGAIGESVIVKGGEGYDVLVLTANSFQEFQEQYQEFLLNLLKTDHGIEKICISGLDESATEEMKNWMTDNVGQTDNLDISVVDLAGMESFIHSAASGADSPDNTPGSLNYKNLLPEESDDSLDSILGKQDTAASVATQAGHIEHSAQQPAQTEQTAHAEMHQLTTAPETFTDIPVSGADDEAVKAMVLTIAGGS